MAATIDQLTHEALGLNESERALLAQTLLESLEPAEEGVEEAWAIEVGRRLERVRTGEAQGRSAEEVFRDIRARHSR
ncbi:MAG TPA: addiction module protein [Chthoniobacter sp.]|jgi:putative addiction module component (TIGR02574 family)